MRRDIPGRNSTVDDLDVLRVLRAGETPVLTAAMIADELPIGRRATLNRLKDLHERGLIEQMDVGPRGQIWWPAEDGLESLPGFGMFADDEAFTEVVEEFRRGDNDDFSRVEDSLSGRSLF